MEEMRHASADGDAGSSNPNDRCPSSASVLQKISDFPPNARNDIGADENTRVGVDFSKSRALAQVRPPRSKIHTRKNRTKGQSANSKENTDTQHQQLSDKAGPCPIGESMPFAGLGVSGRILSRTSTTSLMFQRWKERFWVHLHPATLLLFRSSRDFENWKVLVGEGSPHNQRNKAITSHKLVEWAVDFDAMGILKRKLQKKEKRGKPRAKSREGEDEGDSRHIPVPQRVQKYVMDDVHCKEYNQNRIVLYGFKIQRWTDVGTNIVAAFASANPHETKALRKVIRSCLQLTSPHCSKGFIPKVQNKEPGFPKTTCAHSMINTHATSALSDATESLTSENREGNKRNCCSVVSECGASGSGGIAGLLVSNRAEQENHIRIRIRSRRRRHGRRTRIVL